MILNYWNQKIYVILSVPPNRWHGIIYSCSSVKINIVYIH